MKAEDVNLGSVNWEHGMLLTPEHFLRHEAYVDSALLWVLRYTTDAYGLVGGGARIPEGERGAIRHDPILVIEEDADGLHMAVTQCRAVTPGGGLIDIDPAHPVHGHVARADLEGVTEAPVYVVGAPHRKDACDGPADTFNPQMKTERRPAYQIALRVPPDLAEFSVAVGRLRRQRYGAGYEKDPTFIPACTSMASYSELTAAWRKIVETLTLLSSRYAELHRAMREFAVLFTERGIDTDVDGDALRFTDRMVAALHDCIYDALDAVQPPQRFFSSLRRFFHTTAVYLDLTPSVRQYFDTLQETGETEFVAILERQKDLLRATPTWSVHSDLGVEVRSALQWLHALLHLERGLEGKYVDFRVSPSLEAMNFIFDRGGSVLYKLAAKPSRAQGQGGELMIYFSQLRLEGRDKYRLILVSEPGAVIEQGTRIAIEIRINEGSGFRRQPLVLSCESTSAEQRNFAFDFEAPDVPTITDLKVAVEAHLPIRTALLFERHRFYAGPSADAARRAEPMRPPAHVTPVPPLPVAPPPAAHPDVIGSPRATYPDAALPRRGRLEPQVGLAGDPAANDRAPWDPEGRPRRKRLE